MAAKTVTCTACGEHSGADRRFCIGCGSPLIATGRAGIPPVTQTQFTLPDYLLAARARGEGSARPGSTAEPPGLGLPITGALAIGWALMMGRTTFFVLGVIIAGLVALIVGLWRLRNHEQALARAGWIAAAAGVVLVGLSVAQSVAPREFSRSLVAEMTPAPTAEAPASEAAVTAFARDVEMDRGNAARTGWNPGPGPEGRVSVQWRVFTGGQVYASPVVAGGTVYLATRGSDLIALDAATGAERWRQDLGGYVARSAPAHAGGMIYAAAGYTLTAVAASDGAVAWRAPIRFAGMGSPLAAGGRIYLPTQEGSIYAFDAASGEQLWQRRNEGLIFGSAALADGKLYVGNENGQVFAYEATTGRETWRIRLDGPAGGTPAVSGGSLFLNTQAPAMVALATTTGRERWRAVAGGVASPAIVNGRVFLAASDGGVYALDAESGATEWFFAAGGTTMGAPVVAGGEVFIGAGRSLFALDAASGEPVWRFPTGGDISTSPVVTGGMVFVGSGDGYLYALGSLPNGLS
jgi:eukaryotic-like serine/threonine-protein kinase